MATGPADEGAARSIVATERPATTDIAFRQLETVRAFAFEQLQANGESANAHQRHADYYVSLAHEASKALTGPDQVAWLDRLEIEHDNMRAALSWARRNGKGAIGLQLAGALWPSWERHSHLSEGRRWLEHFLAVEGAQAAPPEARAEALTGARWLAHDQDTRSTMGRGLSSLPTARPERPGRGCAGPTGPYGRARERYQEALALVDESLELARQANDNVVELLVSGAGRVRAGPVPESDGDAVRNVGGRMAGGAVLESGHCPGGTGAGTGG